MSDNLRQITSKNNEKDFLLFLYKHRDNFQVWYTEVCVCVCVCVTMQ